MNDEGIKQDMPARVARWADLEGFTGGHPDSGHEGYARKLYSVIGFGPPDDATSGDPSLSWRSNRTTGSPTTPTTRTRPS
jgi:hypothetical protein